MLAPGLSGVELSYAPAPVDNPMKGEKPLRFANEEQGEEWLVVE